MKTQKTDWSDYETVREILEERNLDHRDASTLATTINKIHDTMKTNIVHFTYEKKNGEIRDAYGTLNGLIIARHWKRRDDDSDSKGFATPWLFNYYDLVRRAWRCARPENILSMDHMYNQI